LLIPAGTFWLYVFIGILAMIWGYYFITETKGVFLEEIGNHWRTVKLPMNL